MATLRVYCETLPYEEVTRREVVELLRKFGLEIVLAVRPWQLGELPRVAAALADAGVPLAVWPMISDEEGRWASAANAGVFGAFVRTMVDEMERAGVRAREVLFDLEPPFAAARAMANGVADAIRAGARAGAGAGAWGTRAFAAAGAGLGALVRELEGRGVATSSAVWPLVALDPPGRSGWQGVLGTPVDALGTGRVSVMVYTSILEGWSRGALRRRDATALLAAASQRTMRRWGEGAGVSLGCVGTGAFEDEPVYASPAELAEDVAIARAAGCRDLSLFDLGGVLARGPSEAWLEAFVGGDEAFPEARKITTARVTAARTLARAATWVLARRR